MQVQNLMRLFASKLTQRILSERTFKRPVSIIKYEVTKFYEVRFLFSNQYTYSSKARFLFGFSTGRY